MFDRKAVLGGLALLGVAAVLGACRPGYIKASELQSKGQGPAACARSCADIGMRMTALVLVGDSLPGCVCQPRVKKTASRPHDEEDDDEEEEAPEPGAAASTTGYVVIAAAAAAQQQQQQQRQQQLQQQRLH